MGKCIVLICTNYSEKKPPGVSFHRLTNEHNKSISKAIGKSGTSRICSEHFSADSFLTVGGRKILSKTALPTLRLKPPDQIDTTANQQIYQAREIPLIIRVPGADEYYCKSKQSTSTESTSKDNSNSPWDCATASTSKYEKESLETTSDNDNEHNYNSSSSKLKINVKMNMKKKSPNKMKYSNKIKQKNVQHLQIVIKHLSKKGLLSEDASEVLKLSCPYMSVAHMKRFLGNLRYSNTKYDEYPVELRSFAMTLQFFSSEAYNYVRRTFSLRLPPPSTIRSWMSSADCHPGFDEAAFQTLKLKCEENAANGMETICALTLGEMTLRKNIECGGGKIWGYVDVGTNIDDDQMECATRALSFMVISLNSNWKTVVGYVLIKRLHAKEKANLISLLIRKLTEVGVNIVSVTGDELSDDFTIARELGAQIEDINNLKPYFLNPIDKSKIFLVFNIEEIVNFLEMYWARFLQIKDGDGNIIDFNLTTSLIDLRGENPVEFFSNQGVLEWRRKTEVSMSGPNSQITGKGVADELEFLMNDGSTSAFQNASATIKFIRMVCDIWDLWYPQKGSEKFALPFHKEHWKPFLKNAINFFKSLTTVEDVPLHSTSTKTPFKGLVITMASLLGIIDTYFEPNQTKMSSFSPEKLSLKHIEFFFSCLRTRHIINPTAYRFHEAYRNFIKQNKHIWNEESSSFIDKVWQEEGFKHELWKNQNVFYFKI